MAPFIFLKNTSRHNRAALRLCDAFLREILRPEIVKCGVAETHSALEKKAVMVKMPHLPASEWVFGEHFPQ